MFLCIWLFHSGRGRNRTCVQVSVTFVSYFLSDLSRPNVRRAELERRVFTRSVLYCLLYISTSRLKPHVVGNSLMWRPLIKLLVLLSSPRFMYRGTYILRYNLYFKYLFVCYYWYVTVLLSCATINTGVVT